MGFNRNRKGAVRLSEGHGSRFKRKTLIVIIELPLSHSRYPVLNHPVTTLKVPGVNGSRAKVPRSTGQGAKGQGQRLQETRVKGQGPRGQGSRSTKGTQVTQRGARGSQGCHRDPPAIDHRVSQTGVRQNGVAQRAARNGATKSFTTECTHPSAEMFLAEGWPKVFDKTSSTKISSKA